MYKWGGDRAKAMMVTSQNHRQSSIMTVILPYPTVPNTKQPSAFGNSKPRKVPTARQSAISIRGPRNVASRAITGDSRGRMTAKLYAEVLMTLGAAFNNGSCIPFSCTLLRRTVLRM
jgi:hypothetical protein